MYVKQTLKKKIIIYKLLTAGVHVPSLELVLDHLESWGSSNQLTGKGYLVISRSHFPRNFWYVLYREFERNQTHSVGCLEKTSWRIEYRKFQFKMFWTELFVRNSFWTEVGNRIVCCTPDWNHTIHSSLISLKTFFFEPYKEGF